MKKIILFIFSTILCMSAFASETLALTPQAITKYIREHGAKETVRNLYKDNDSRRWDFVIHKMESGDSDWLSIAKIIAEGTDAGTSEDLIVTLAIALPKNPRRVLQLIGTTSFLSYETVCNAPFIEPTSVYLRNYLRKTRQVLKNLKDTTVEEQRVKCLSQIEK
ncbi:hypothetical protein AAKU55_005722 [Oxalobacteraceae bacterium GrIS 1.11]